jgi:ribonuclease P protein component
MRRGSKCGRATVVVYLARTVDSKRVAGFAVSKAVGGAVVRNRVKRRLRAIVAADLSSLPAGAHVVVRALPAAATASFLELSSDVASALASVAAEASA